jgi:pilus assembly protein TadC
MTNIVDQVTAMYPDIKAKLKLAAMRDVPRSYVGKNLKNAFIYAVMMGVLSFFFIDKMHYSLVWVPILFVVFFVGFFNVLMKRVDSKIIKREKEIDKEVLFAGRYLLIKINSGQPLVNSLIDASKSYGISDHYFKDIVRDIELGTPIEQALENGMKYTPSKKFKRILFQITNALKIGIDVTNSLQAVLDEIAEEQLIEIQKYGRKLNSFSLFYMLIAIVVPSLGMTLAVIVASFNDKIAIGFWAFVLVLLMLIFVQFMFIILFRSIRPKVDI